MFSFERESRTPQSEVYVVENEAGDRARADIHYAAPLVYATLCVPEDWSEDDIQDLIAELDDRVVRTAEPFRDDFLVTVWRGVEVGVYSNDESLEPFADPAASD